MVLWWREDRWRRSFSSIAVSLSGLQGRKGQWAILGRGDLDRRYR
jgi:hypothetical protein